MFDTYKVLFYLNLLKILMQALVKPAEIDKLLSNIIFNHFPLVQKSRLLFY